LKGEEIKD